MSKAEEPRVAVPLLTHHFQETSVADAQVVTRSLVLRTTAVPVRVPVRAPVIPDVPAVSVPIIRDAPAVNVAVI
jgi:hypothetical protein